MYFIGNIRLWHFGEGLLEDAAAERLFCHRMPAAVHCCPALQMVLPCVAPDGLLKRAAELECFDDPAIVYYKTE